MTEPRVDAPPQVAGDIEAAVSEFRQLLQEAAAAPGVSAGIPFRTIVRLMKLGTGKPFGDVLMES